MRLYIKMLCVFMLVGSLYALPFSVPLELKPNLSILVTDLKTKKVVVKLNEDTPRLVASNVKLFTTFFALQELKPDFRYVTRLYYSGNVEGGVLDGDIYLVGGGDPTLNNGALYQIFAFLKHNNINKINGNLIMDNSIFNSTPIYSMLDTNPYDVDTILPSGLMINGEVSNVRLSDKSLQSGNNFYQNFYTPGITNKISFMQNESPCIGVYSKIKITKSSSGVELNGEIPVSCSDRVLNYRFYSNFLYNKLEISKVLNDLSIKLTGQIIEGKLKNEYNANLLYSYYSPSLEQILIPMNRYSINLIAETLLLTVGAYKTQNHNTYLDSKNKFIQFLTENKLVNPQTNIENGAGLSRFEYFSAQNMINLLQLVYNSPYQAYFEASLPTSGEDGTLQNKFIVYKNQVRAKTGTLNDTLAYSGYFYSTQGNVYMFSIIANDINSTSNNSTQNINLIANNLFAYLNNLRTGA